MISFCAATDLGWDFHSGAISLSSAGIEEEVEVAALLLCCV